MRDYPVEKCNEAPLTSCEESNRQRLTRIKKGLLDRVADIDRALALLEKNPEIEELTDLLRRI